MDPVDFGHAMADALSEPASELDTLDAPTTESVVAAMLAENTGRHLLDSGGAYGRNWERNQTRDFASEPKAYLDGIALDDRGDCYPMLSLYHFLTQRLEYDAEADREFHDFANHQDWHREPWRECLAAWAESKGLVLSSQGNSYNEENYLDQDFQWHALVTPEDKDTERDLFDANTLFAIETHNGCDIRGGYSAPRIFRTSLLMLLDMSRTTIACQGREPEQAEQLPGLEDGGKVYHVWDIDHGDVTESAVSGHRWLDEHLLGHDDEPFTNVRSLPPELERVPSDPEGIIYHDGSAWYCPRCGAELIVDAPYPSEG